MTPPSGAGRLGQCAAPLRSPGCWRLDQAYHRPYCPRRQASRSPTRRRRARSASNASIRSRHRSESLLDVRSRCGSWCTPRVWCSASRPASRTRSACPALLVPRSRSVRHAPVEPMTRPPRKSGTRADIPVRPVGDAAQTAQQAPQRARYAAQLQDSDRSSSGLTLHVSGVAYPRHSGNATNCRGSVPHPRWSPFGRRGADRRSFAPSRSAGMLGRVNEIRYSCEREETWV